MKFVQIFRSSRMKVRLIMVLLFAGLPVVVFFQNCSKFHALDMISSLDSASTSVGGPTSTSALQSVSNGAHVQDVLVWYDFNAGGVALNPHEVVGPMPVHPANIDVYDTTDSGVSYSTYNPIFNYNSQFPVNMSDSEDKLRAMFRQHAYWLMAMGATVVSVDFSNVGCSAMAAQSGPYQAASGAWLSDAKKTLLIMLDTFQDLKNRNLFPVPKISIAMRVISSKNLPVWINDVGDKDLLDVASCLAQEIRGIADRYPEIWYRLQDGTADADLPFIIAFTNMGPAWRSQGPQWPRVGEKHLFNVRYTGVPFSEIGMTESRDGTLAVKSDFPYWPFQEPNVFQGVFRFTGNQAEFGSAWVAMWSRKKHGDWTNFAFDDVMSWQGMLQPLNGFSSTFRAYLDASLKRLPKVLAINRFNYGVAWKDQPAEGLSIYKSTVIEPSLQLGFNVLNDTAQGVYLARGLKPQAPGVVTNISLDDGTLKFNLSGVNLELCVVSEVQAPMACEGLWVFMDLRNLDFNNNNIYSMSLPSDLMSASRFTIYTRNSFGVSEGVTIKDGKPAHYQFAGFFQVGSSGVYFSNGNDAYCGVVDWDMFLNMGGQADLGNLHQASSLPTDMTFNVSCNIPQPAGFFKLRAGGGIFFSNGNDAYCAVTSWDKFLSMGGRSDQSNVAIINHLPVGMRGDSSCP